MIFEGRITATQADIDELGHVEFNGGDGKPRARAKTTWAIIDKASGRAVRVPQDVAAPFLA